MLRPGIDGEPGQCYESDIDAALRHVPGEKLKCDEHGERCPPEFSGAIEWQMPLSETTKSPQE